MISEQAAVDRAPVADQKPMPDHQSVVSLGEENDVDQNAPTNDVEVIVRQFLIPNQVSWSVL